MECRKLGYEIVESLDFRGDVKGFEIKGVSEELQERFSKLTHDIDEEIARQERNLGRALTAAGHDVSLETRSFKLAETDSAAVRNHQLEQLSREEMELLQKLVQESFQRERRRKENRSAEQAIDEVLPELFEQQSVMKTEQILAEVLTRNLGKIPLAELQTALSKHPELRKLPENYMIPLAVMEAEQYAFDAIERERGLYAPLNVHFRAFEGEKNRASQREAVQGILRSRDRFVLLRGVAGSGKTSTLKELARGLAQAPRVLAPTNSAVEVLKREGFPHSQTVAGFLLRPPEFNGLVIVDESGLNSLRDGVALLRLAEEKQLRILFVGDSLQHHAVERGDFFHLLEEHSQIKRFSLTEIHRQQKEEYRLGVKACADGNFAEAFERFDRNGFLHENGAGYLKMTAKRFVGLYHREQVIAVAPTHRECDALTAEIRARLPLGKIVQTPSVFRSARFSRARLRNPKTYHPGQTVMFVRKMKNIAEAGTVAEIVKVERNCLHLSNGKLLRLPGAADYIAVGERRPMELRQGDVIQFQVNLREQKIFNGNLARITGTPGVVELLKQDMNPVADSLRHLPADFAGYDYGWVTTSHKSQGRTARHVVIAAQKLDRKAFYVSCSRGRRSLALFCPDKAHLKNQLVRSDDFRRNAADLLPPAPKKDYLTSSGNRIREWKEKYSMEKNAYERGLAAYREHRNELRQKLKPLQAESALLEKEIDRAHVESKVYERYKTLPWYKRLKQRLTGKVPSKSTHHEKALLRMRELERLKEELQVQIDGLKAPCPPSEHRFPLVFGSRIAAWFKRQNRNEKPQISAPVRKLCEFVHAPSEKTFTAWLSLRKPNWHWQVFEQVFAEIFEKLPMEAFCRIPQTPSQYHVFRREENELLKMLEPVYHKNVVQEYRRERIELEKRETMRRWEQHEKLERMERMKREENLRREREDRLKWEADALAEERRRNPISDAQRHVLEDLHKEERLERMPSELSMREASALMANIFADDPLNPMQKANLLKHIRNGNLPDMPDSAINALTQKDYMPLIRQAWQKRDRDYVPEKARAQGKTRGMEL